MSNLIVSQINGGPTGVINAIINGNFGINQRGVSGTVTLAAGAYGHDRWKAGASGCTYTFATTNNVTTLTISAGSLIQVIEGLNLGSGTYTLSWTGTAQGKIGAGSYAGSGVTGTAVGGTNLNIEFNTGTVSLVQFEQGAVATPFERRPYGTELALCQRYFYNQVNYMGQPAPFNEEATGGIGQSTGSAVVFRTVRVHPVQMRASPTVTFANVTLYDGGVTRSATGINHNGASIYNRSTEWTTSGNMSGAGRPATEFVTTSGFIACSAEL